jgi:hypothetical protein
MRRSLSGHPSSDIPSPTHRNEKALPPDPSLSMVSIMPKNLVDKELPALPRRPVGGYLSDTDIVSSPSSTIAKVTKDDIEVGRHTSSGWSLFPTVKPSEIKRPATSTGNYFTHRETKEIPNSISSNSSSPVTALPTIPSASPVLRPTLGQANSDTHLQNDRDQLKPEVFTNRLGRLRKSFSVIGNINKKPKRGHSSQPTGLRRKWSMLHLSTKSRTSAGRQDAAPELGNPDHPARSWSPPALHNANEPVGIYDPASKMWLIPQKSREASYGIYDPDSQQWLAPSPRTDSYRKEVKIDDQDHKTNTAMRKDEVEGEGEEHGALSLAEKLEIIRYNPLIRTFSTPTTTIHNRPSTSNSDTGTPRPWKAGRVLGITTPPTEDFASGLPMDEDMVVFPDRMMHSVTRSSTEGSGSGYMSFESHEENQRKDWKGFWKSVQLGKRMTRLSNGRKSASAV